MNTIERDLAKSSASPAQHRLQAIVASLIAAVSLLLTGQGKADSLDVGDLAIDTTSRTLPATLHNAVDVGAFTFTGATGSLAIAVNVGPSAYSVAKRYVIPMRSNLVGISAANTWLKVLPTYDTGTSTGNDFDLDIKVSAGVMNVRLRVAATNGVTAGTASIVVESTGVSSIAFSTTSVVVTPPTAAQVFGGSVVTQIGGRVGINTAPSTDAALDVNGGDTKGLRIRPRTLAGSPTTGTWYKGTLIVDSTGNLWACVADGTPGNWRKVNP